MSPARTNGSGIEKPEAFPVRSALITGIDIVWRKLAAGLESPQSFLPCRALADSVKAKPQK
jgi:hypothetical protein